MALVVDLSQAVKNTHFVRDLDRDLERDLDRDLDRELDRIVRRKVFLIGNAALNAERGLFDMME